MLPGAASDRSVVPFVGPGAGSDGERPPNRRRGRRWGLGLVVVGAAVALGPRPRVDARWVEPELGLDVDAWLASAEAGVPRLKDGEVKSVVWADAATRGRTPVALVYLHGFSGDRHEVEPLVADLARDLGANAYYARLTGHGQDGEALAGATAEDWLADVSEAVAVGARIGERVVLIGTSTGGTLAFWAAAQPEAAGRVHALVLVSPNLGLRDRRSEMLLWPWGGLIGRLVQGPERCFEPVNEAQARHWTTCYPTRALLPLMATVELGRSLDPRDVDVPVLVFYSSRDEVVDPAAVERLVGALGADALRVDDAGDPAHHILAGAILSGTTTDRMREQIVSFLRRSSVLTPEL